MVVARRRDVVRRVGVEHRREQLDVSAPDVELGLPAAVGLDSLALRAWGVSPSIAVTRAGSLNPLIVELNTS